MLSVQNQSYLKNSVNPAETTSNPAETKYQQSFKSAYAGSYDDVVEISDKKKKRGAKIGALVGIAAIVAFVWLGKAGKLGDKVKDFVQKPIDWVKNLFNKK